MGGCCHNFVKFNNCASEIFKHIFYAFSSPHLSFSYMYIVSRHFQRFFIYYFTETLSEAKMHESRAEETSNLSEDDEEEVRKRKRKPNLRYDSGDSDGDDDEVPVFTSARKGLALPSYPSLQTFEPSFPSPSSSSESSHKSQPPKTPKRQHPSQHPSQHPNQHPRKCNCDQGISYLFFVFSSATNPVRLVVK